MKNGDIANFRLSNSVLGRQRHAAAGDGQSVRPAGHRVRRHRVQGASSAPKFSYGCAVFLDTDRVNFQKEGFSKEELLAGPRAGAAEERLAVRRADPAARRSSARATCSRAARSTTSPPSRRRSTTSRSACPAPRCFVHPHTGRGRRDRRGDRDAARREAPRQRRPSSASTRRSTSSTRRRTTRRRLPLLPERVQAHVHRHEDARRPHEPLHLRLLLREGHGRVARGDARARRRAQGAEDAVPEPRRLRGAARVPALLHARRRCRPRDA